MNPPRRVITGRSSPDATGTTPQDPDEAFAQLARTLIVTAMTERGLTYADLAERLNAQAPAGTLLYTRKSLTNRLSGGRFGAGFFLRCLAALDLRLAEVGDLSRIVQELQAEIGHMALSMARMGERVKAISENLGGECEGFAEGGDTQEE